MKLIATSQKVTDQQAIPVDIPILDQTGPAPSESDYQVTVLATKPEAGPQVLWSIPLSWKLSGLPRPDVRMNQDIRDWCNYSTLFSNWLYSALSVFVSIAQEELTIPVPDQFIDDLDVTTLTFTREYGKDSEWIKIYC
ncbi:MAG TPA: hypothetical protein VGK46_13365 [Saprospiraceae bacterium]